MKLFEYKEGWHNSQADPYILKSSNGKYYVYVTGGDGVHAYESDKLESGYNYIGKVFTMQGKKEYWAPAVTEIDGKYYMYVSCMPENSDDVHQQAMHVAVSNSANGPFENAKQIIAPFSIDAHVVQNQAGLFIFYSVNDYEAQRAGTYVVVDKMIDPFTPCGNPVSVVRPTLDEEIFMKNRFKQGQHWHTLEGAFYFNQGDWHYLIYSGNCYQNEYYYLGYAVAHTSERDLTKIKFTKYPNPETYYPLISKNEFEAGTGHNSVIYDNGEWYAVYHGRDLVPDKRLIGDNRTGRICKLKVNGEKLIAERYENKL